VVTFTEALAALRGDDHADGDGPWAQHGHGDLLAAGGGSEVDSKRGPGHPNATGDRGGKADRDRYAAFDRGGHAHPDATAR
jgi:hypothetical protein